MARRRVPIARRPDFSSESVAQSEGHASGPSLGMTQLDVALTVSFFVIGSVLPFALPAAKSWWSTTTCSPGAAADRTAPHLAGKRIQRRTANRKGTGTAAGGRHTRIKLLQDPSQTGTLRRQPSGKGRCSGRLLRTVRKRSQEASHRGPRAHAPVEIALIAQPFISSHRGRPRHPQLRGKGPGGRQPNTGPQLPRQGSIADALVYLPPHRNIRRRIQRDGDGRSRL